MSGGADSVRARLRATGLPLTEARALLAHVTGRPREHWIAHDDEALPAGEAGRFEALAARRRAGEPLAYLLGVREFHGREFRVAPAVLIPRPETELLCEAALARAPRAARILDLGTGSGVIAITLALECPGADVTATDVSPDALAIAEANAGRLGAAVRFLQGPWYAPLGEARFDLVVSNPPYIAAGDPHLGEGDLRYEPRQALTDEADGLSALRSIVAGAPVHLEPGGRLCLEHGYDQAAAVRALLAQAGFVEVESLRDLAGIERVSVGRRRTQGPDL